MEPVPTQPGGTSFAALRRLASPEAKPEHCDFCSVAIPGNHRHLVEIGTRNLVCVCDPCGLRFEGVVGSRFELVPRDARVLPGFSLSDVQWESLSLPINLAFFVRSRGSGKVTALYPSPAGVTESLLPLEHWQAIVKDNPMLTHLAPEVEALLVNRVGETRDYFIAPIDRCYELAGLIRLHWRGLSGGETVWQEIRQFFTTLQPRSPNDLEPREVCHA
jgi:hypothetical protein